MCVGPRSAVFAPLERHRPDRHRRGARELLQARGRPALRRAHRGPRSAPTATAPCWWPAAPRPGPRACWRWRACGCPQRVDRRPMPARRGARHARPPPAAASRDADGAGRPAPRRRQGDPAAQPPRLVELPVLPRLRPGVAVSQLRGGARAAPPRRLRRLPPLRPSRARARPLRRVRLGVGGAPRRRHRAHRARAARRAGRTDGFPDLPPRRRLRRACRARPRTLQDFAGGPAGVLVGTQMVAKGHDFPDVSLGIVLDADQTLRFPDFRAEERTFALITQLAGRTGRGRTAGRAVLVQTLAPDARPIAFATRHDSDGFVADELSRREALALSALRVADPVVCSAEEEALARETAAAIAAELPARRRRAGTGTAVSAARPGAQPARHQGDRAPAGDRRRRARRRPARPGGGAPGGDRQRRRRSPVTPAVTGAVPSGVRRITRLRYAGRAAQQSTSGARRRGRRAEGARGAARARPRDRRAARRRARARAASSAIRC